MMKRNIIRISLALVIILSLCLSVGSPAIAADNENKPVAWVTWSGSNRGGKNMAHHLVQKFHVKKMADENGNNVAYLLVTTVIPYDGNTYPVCWRFVDGGEPAKGNDELRNYVYLVPNINPSLVPWPPQTGLDFFIFPWITNFGPSGVGNNIQVKITDAY
jgi:hypothetical protein